MDKYQKYGIKKVHEWGVVAQCKKPYREFSECQLCHKFRENTAFNKHEHPKLMTRKQFIALSKKLIMYEADSNNRLIF